MSIGRNTALGLVTNTFVLGLGIILSIVLTRSLGPEQRGVYVLLVTANTLLANLVNLTLAAPFSTFLARGRFNLGQLNTLAILLSLAMGVVCFVGTSLAFPFIADSIFRQVPYTYLLVALALVPATIYQIYWSSMMMGLNRLVLMNTLNLVLNVGNTLVMVLLVGVLRMGLPGFLIGWSITSVSGLLALLAFPAREQRFAWPPRRGTFNEVMSFGLRMHGTSIAHQLFLRFDMFAVNTLVSTAGVGFYSLATSLAEKLWVLPNALAPSSLSKIAQLPRSESALLTAKVTRTAVLAMLVVAVALAAVSPWLIPFLYGVDFEASVLPLVILMFGTPGFAAMLVVNNYVLGQMERPGLLSVISWLELAVSIPLYIGLIVWQGIVGAALASTITYLLGMAGTLYIFVRDSRLSVREILLPRGADFQDYIRVVRSILQSMPVPGRHAGRPS